MAILAIAIVMLYIGSVSAAENDDLNATVTAIDNSQNDNIVIYENNAQTDDTTQGGSSSVSFASENEDENLVGASEDDVLGADTTLTIVNEKDSYSTTDSITIKMGSYSMASGDSSVEIYLNNARIAETTYSVINSGYSVSLTTAITGENTIYCSGSSLFGTYTSESVTFNVASPITIKDTTVTINVPSTATAGESFTIPYHVYEDGTTTEVSEGTLKFYEGTTQIGSDIDLSSHSGEFTYTYSTAGAHEIHAEYTGTGNYADSQSTSGTVTISENQGGSGGNNDESSLYYVNFVLSDDSLSSYLQNGIYYIPSDVVVNILATVSNSTLGSDISNYIGSDVAKIYINNYSTSNTVTIGGSKTIEFTKVGYNEIQAVFEGNDLGLSPANSNLLKFVTHIDTTTTLEVMPVQTAGQGSTLRIVPKVQYTLNGQTYTVDKGQVRIERSTNRYNYYETFETINAGDYLEYAVSNSNTYYLRAYYLGYSDTISGNSFEIFSSSSYTNPNGDVYVSGSTRSQAMWLVMNGDSQANGQTEITITAGDTVSFLSDFD
ncbi:MAG: Ig-like domain-containing protein, partial [Methanobrevibacter sp.]|nr:Ig-like domain-containing protein [Methanobrevibacter sp.]